MSGHTKENCPFAEDIEVIKQKVNQKEWYTNKDLHKYIVDLFQKFDNLSGKLDETNQKIDEYNGLRDDIQKYKDEIEEIKKHQSKEEGKEEGVNTLKDNISWIISILLAIITILALNGVIG